MMMVHLERIPPDSGPDRMFANYYIVLSKPDTKVTKVENFKNFAFTNDDTSFGNRQRKIKLDFDIFENF